MSELAHKLIEENRETRAKELDLANCGLSEIPPEVGELFWLEAVHFSDGWYDFYLKQQYKSANVGPTNQPLAGLEVLQKLSGLRKLSLNSQADLSPLARLSDLRELHLGGQVSDVSPLASLSALQSLDLSDTQVSDVSLLASLSALQILNLGFTQVSDVSPLASLSALQYLSLHNTQVSDLSPLASLSALQSLDLRSTQVSDLSPLASLSALQILNLGFTQVSDVSPLASLSALQSLDLRSTQVSDLSPLASLSALQSLYLYGTRVSDVSPLASLSALRSLNLGNTPVSNLSPLASLSALQYLNLGNTQVSNLSPLASLSALQYLNLGNTQVSNLSPLASLSALQYLSLHNTQVSDVSPLASLSALQILDLSSTQVSNLFPLASLSALQYLDLSSTQVSNISALLPLILGGCPAKWDSKSWEGPGIYLENCPLTNPPPEIVRQGNDAILNYFAELAKSGVDQLYEAKMLIVGEGGAGKTSLLRRLYQQDQPLPMENESTKGIAIHQHSFLLKNGRTFRLNVWDFGGQEIYHATHQFFLTHRSLYLLLDDTRKDDKSVQDPCFRYWLGLVEVFGGGSPVLVFQNEKSGRSKSIDIDGIKGRYTNVKEKYEGDLAIKGAADRLRDAIEYFAANLSHIGEELPAPWIRVRAEIETCAASEPYISQREYFNIYGHHLEFDESQALSLSQYLHDLGVFLHFQNDILLKDTVILQNEWATQAVFRILDDEDVKKSLGRFGEKDCARIWKDSAYATKHAELLALMKKFELCYELPDKAPREWLAPQLLPPAKPADVKDWNQQDDLVLRYKYQFLPKGIVGRLTVRLHRFVKRTSMAWTTGVLFERDNTAALVELLADGQQIEIRARGPEAMGLLSAVSFDLDALNESFQGLQDKVAKLVPCPCETCANTSLPYFFDYRDLVTRMERGKREAECGRSYRDMDVVTLLYQAPGWTKGESGERAKTLRIFLASSSELREDRDAFELYMRQWNDELRKRGIYLEIMRWENFLDAMSDTRLQDEYNKAVRACDVFVALFFTKAGKFTDEEFEVAWGQFMKSGKPKIFTYFKSAGINTGSARRDDLNSLWDFQEKLKKLGHYPTSYDHTADLKLQFRDQLSRVIELGTDGMARRARG